LPVVGLLVFVDLEVDADLLDFEVVGLVVLDEVLLFSVVGFFELVVFVDLVEDFFVVGFFVFDEVLEVFDVVGLLVFDFDVVFVVFEVGFLLVFDVVLVEVGFAFVEVVFDLVELVFLEPVDFVDLVVGFFDVVVFEVLVEDFFVVGLVVFLVVDFVDFEVVGLVDFLAVVVFAVEVFEVGFLVVVFDEVVEGFFFAVVFLVAIGNDPFSGVRNRHFAVCSPAQPRVARA